MPDWELIAKDVSTTTGKRFAPIQYKTIGGGCINAAFHLQDRTQSYFVKLNDLDKESMFSAEAEGLRAMQRTETVRVPTPICYGHTARQAYLVMEYIPLQASNRQSLRQLGVTLAQMHQNIAPTFGWQRDNTIGSTPQHNTETLEWVEFWRKQRLEFQFSLAARYGFGGSLQRKGEQLCARFQDLFNGYSPVPSLLHGDLWGGNQGRDAAGQPVIFDPATYYGDREADLAMTELFGGFGLDFYATYNESYGLDSGYQVRKTLYNLYHILNHLNLFGGGYLPQVEDMVDRLLAELG